MDKRKTNRQARSTADVADTDNTNPFTIGSATSFRVGRPRAFPGDIDDFRIFSRWLSNGEINELYQANGGNTSLLGGRRLKIGPLREAYWKGQLLGGEKEPIPLPDSATKDAPHPHAVQFDGNHYAKLDPPPKFTSGDFTISLWLNPVRTGDWALPFMRGFGCATSAAISAFQLNRDSGDLGFAATSQDYSGDENGSSSGWIFGWGALESRLRVPSVWPVEPCRRHPSRRRLHHVDERQAGGSEKSSADISDTKHQPVHRGRDDVQAGRIGTMYQGTLDDFRIFRRCLSDKEIAELYRSNGDESVLSTGPSSIPRFE